MKNFETKTTKELRQEVYNALQNGTPKEQEIAYNNLFEGIQNDVLEQAKAQMTAFNEGANDDQVLVNRGTRKALTSDEKKYFNAAIERKGFDGIEEAFPVTVIEDVFKDLTTEHPILSRIDIKDTTALAQYIVADPTKATTFWGPICEDIKQMVIEGFKVMTISSSRLSGFVPVCKGMFELGPTWIATYVTTIMTEIMTTALETAVIAGTGKDQPIGIIKKLSGATDGVYPDKPKVTLANFEPKSLAGIRSAMAEAKTDTGGVVIMVNPKTYWAKLFPNLAYKKTDGQWVHDVLPTGEQILQSYAVPVDTLIFGDPENYFLGVSGRTRIDKYDQTLAIEDMDLYIAKFYGYGQAKHRDAFFVADIEAMEGATTAALEVVAETPEV